MDVPSVPQIPPIAVHKNKSFCYNYIVFSLILICENFGKWHFLQNVGNQLIMLLVSFEPFSKFSQTAFLTLLSK